MMDEITPLYFGADAQFGMYTQFRVLHYRDGIHYPITTFWTDRVLSKVASDRVYFFSPALRRFKKTLVEGSLVAWLDFDGDFPLDFHAKPSLIVSTGGGYHVYWKLKDFCYPEQLSLLLARLLELYPSADPMVRDVTRFMRWMGTYNLKYDPPRLCEVFERNEVVHVYRDLMAC